MNSMNGLLGITVVLSLVQAAPAAAGQRWEKLARRQVVVTLENGEQVAGKLGFVGANLMLLRTDSDRVVRLDRSDIKRVELRPAGWRPPRRREAVGAAASLEKRLRTPSRHLFGFRLSPLVGGTATEGSQSLSLSTAWAATPFWEYQITEWFSVGFETQVTLNVRGDGERTASRELATGLRLKLGVPLGQRARVYAIASPGIATLFPGSNFDTEVGFHLGLVGGASVKVARRFGFFFELGYQMSRYSWPGGAVYLGYLTPQFGVQVSL